jgi:dolichyl-diphosphooligosaccharide---protein glycosyltransferase
MSTARSKKDAAAYAFLWTALYGGLLVYGLYLALYSAYQIRLRAILDYGPVIHEFDPYFNYRATEVRVCL